jgi:hypothetical protein
MRRTELATAAVLALLGLAAIGWLIPRYVADTGSSSALPPSFMPYVAAGLVTAAALASLAAALRRRGSDGPAPLTWATLRFLGASIAVLAGGFLVMAVAGYIAGGAVLVAGTLLVARVRPATIAATAVLTPVALWLLFVRLLDTPLP